MVTASLSTSPFPPFFAPNPNPTSSARLPLPLFSPRRRVAALGTAADSSSAAAVDASKRRRMILESYGLDPDNFTGDDRDGERDERSNQNSRRGKSRRGEPRTAARRKGAPVVDVAAATKPPPRTTHKLLQVLAGKARRRKLLSPKGLDVRPMMEIVKGAVFDILQVAGGCPSSLRPGRWLDLYSGTGSVGIEAISRGCSEAHFVEMDPWVVSEVLRPNLEATGFSDCSRVHMVRVEAYLEQAMHSTGKDGPFDYISVTPPYTEVHYPTLMDQIENSSLIGDDSFVVVEYPLKTTMADSCSHLVKIVDRRFGRTNLLIYGPSWAEKKRKPRKI